MRKSLSRSDLDMIENTLNGVFCVGLLRPTAIKELGVLTGYLLMYIMEEIIYFL